MSIKKLDELLAAINVAPGHGMHEYERKALQRVATSIISQLFAEPNSKIEALEPPAFDALYFAINDLIAARIHAERRGAVLEHERTHECTGIYHNEPNKVHCFGCVPKRP